MDSIRSSLLTISSFSLLLIAPIASSQTIANPLSVTPSDINSIEFHSVELTLSDVIVLLLQNNRQLRNAALDRMVQTEQLRDAENAFVPRVTPILGLGISQSFGDLALLSVDPTTETARLEGQMRTPLGTAITVTISPLENQPFGITINQPLLRGAGQQINRAPIERARQIEQRNVLNFRQALGDRITEATIAYRAIARAQATLKIQQLSIENQRRQLELIAESTNVDQQERSNLSDFEANIAVAEAQVVIAQNQLEQARSNLLNLLDLDESIEIVVPQALIDEFRTGEVAAESIAQMRLEALLQTAYTNRADFQLAQLDIQSAELDELIAQDNERWNLNLRLGANLGDASDASAELSLSRVFGDRSLQTATFQAEIAIEQQQNNLAEVTEAIRQSVGDSLRNVISASQLISATRQAREAAERRLEIATARFANGDGIDLFQILSLQNDVVTAQNNEVNAKIDFLDALARLDQAVGVTLDSWNVQVEASGLLNP